MGIASLNPSYACYTLDLLRKEFADMDILHLAEHDSVIREGAGHSGMSALIDMVAMKRGGK